MASKSYFVRFANSNIGADLDNNQQLRDVVPDLVLQYGEADQRGHHLPAVQMEGEHFQVRHLLKVGRVWQGSFARLRDEAPHVIGNSNVERQIDLEDGDRILEKTFFIYYEDRDILVFMMSKNVGYLGRFAVYWSRLRKGEYVDSPPVVDHDRMAEILGGGVREINFTYASVAGTHAGAPKWSQRAMEMLQPVHGAVGKFTVRAPRGSALAGRIDELIVWASRGGEVQRANVRLVDEKDPIDLFVAPIKVRIDVRIHGSYPDERSAFEALQQAYSEQVHRLPGRPPGTRRDRLRH